MRRSRWKPQPLPDVGFRFVESDIELCKLLAPTANARHPWAYQYLPTSYFAPLLGRSHAGVSDRLRELSDYRYIRKPEQPRNNYRELIYALDNKGADELREAGLTVPNLRERKLAHELMRGICAASFEIGCKENGLSISVEDVKMDIRPDLPVFRINGHRIFLEADVGSETLHSARPETTTIGGKIEQYLDILKPHDLVLFVTTRATRRDSMLEVLKAVITTRGKSHRFADNFGFASIAYDRFVNFIPKPSGWAITNDWLRAGNTPPFNFLEGR